jgi:serine/threonine protein kinase
VEKLKLSPPASPKGTITNQKETPIRATAASKVSTSSAHEKKEFSVADLRAHFIKPPKPFSTEQQVAAECNRWQKEGNSYQAIVTELGRILLSSDKALDADLSDFEAQQLFPYDLHRARQLTSPAFLKSLTQIAANNEVEWLAELHHPIQQCFKHFIDPLSEPITAASFGNAVVAQTTEKDQRLKPDRVFGWSEVLSATAIECWVGTIQIPFLIIESKPASAQGKVGDLYKKFILEAKAYEHQETCIAVYEKSADYKATICLPLVFGMYFVGANITFDVYRVVDNVKMPLTYKVTNYIDRSRRVLRAIIAIKGWAQLIRDNLVEIEEKFPVYYPSDAKEEQDSAEKEHDEESDAEGDEPDPRDTDYEEKERREKDEESDDLEPSDNQGPRDEIHLHESSKSHVVARFVEQSGHYVVLKTTALDDGMREVELLRTKLQSLAFVPQLLDFVAKDNKAILKMSWHRGRHPRKFRSHRELQEFLRALLQNVSSIHKRGIVHNDLKESNLLWDSKSLTIIDFGGAEEYPSNSAVYTRGYRAPESIRTPASDVYSCGVVLFNLLLGIQIRSSDQVMYLRRCNSLADIEASIAPFLPIETSLWHSSAWELAKRMTDPNPNKRISIKKALQDFYLFTM